jgi:hypothetical protein
MARSRRGSGSVFQRTYRDGKGKLRKTTNWYIEFVAATARCARRRISPNESDVIARRQIADYYLSSTAIRSAGCPEAFSSACFAAPAIRTSSAFAPGWSFR